MSWKAIDYTIVMHDFLFAGLVLVSGSEPELRVRLAAPCCGTPKHIMELSVELTLTHFKTLWHSKNETDLPTQDNTNEVSKSHLVSRFIPRKNGPTIRLGRCQQCDSGC